MKGESIWQNNLEYAELIEKICKENYKYSHETLISLLKNTAEYLRVTGKRLEEIEKDFQVLWKLP